MQLCRYLIVSSSNLIYFLFVGWLSHTHTHTHTHAHAWNNKAKWSTDLTVNRKKDADIETSLCNITSLLLLKT